MNPAQTVTLPRRLGAVAYDTMLVIGSIMIIGGIFATIFARTMGLETLPPGSTPANVLTVLYLLMAYGFFTYFWTHGGQTLGMRAWKIRVETAEGKALNQQQAGYRFAWSLLSWATCGIGFLVSLIDPENRTWHDRFSHTRLVRV